MGNVSSLLKTLGSLDKIIEYRKEALNTIIKKFTVDTVMCTDTREYETGIKHETKYPNWVIVEQYGTDFEASKKGHGKWVSKIKKGETKFTDCIEYGF